MFYRQKILLALTELCGRSSQNTDLQKLLFLFCQETGENHYDFFPYKFGAFSFVSYDDKRKLIEQGHLKDTAHFELASNTSYLNQLKAKDRADILAFAQKTQNLRGRTLIRKTYLEYPKYATRSTIANTILTSEEQDKVKADWNDEKCSALFSIGYEGKSIDEYLRCLILNNVNVLLDVRRNPFSRKHGFSQKQMKRYLESAGIQYTHLPELGIASHLRKNLDDKASYEALFAHYSANVLSNQSGALCKIMNFLEEYKRVALTCFEADPSMCHRHKVTEALNEDPRFSYPIIHL